MIMTPEVIKDYFADNYGDVTLYGNARQRFKGARLYVAGDVVSADYIYVMQPDVFEAYPQREINAAVAGHTKARAAKGFCMLSCDIGAEALMNIICECFQSYAALFEKLYEAIALGESIEALLEKALPLMRNPIFIDDSSFRTLARLKDYPTEDFKDNEYIFMQQSGHHSADYIYAMLNSNVSVESSAISPRPLVHKLEFLSHRTLYSTIKVDGEIVGFFSCVELQTQFTPGMMDVFEALTEMWTVALTRQSKLTATRQKSLDNDLFLGIMNGSISDAELTRTAFAQAGLSSGDYFVVYTVTDVDTKANPFLLPRIMELLVTNLENSFAIADGSNIILIINRRYDEGLRETLVRLIGFYLAEFHVVIGISLGFSEPNMLPLFYDQALAATRLGALADGEGHEPRVYGYGDVVSYDILERFGGKEGRAAICHPAVFELLRHDREKKMNLLPTLKVFAECMGDTAVAAERLYLHRNSLYYRLKQIQALTGIDLASERVLAHVMLSMRVLQIDGELG